MKRLSGEVHICGPSRDYYAGDPRPPKEAGYFDFMEWQEAQIRNKRPKKKRMKRATTLLLALACAGAIAGCDQLTGNDKVLDEQRKTNDILLAEPAEACDENPQGQGCVDQRTVEVGLECLPSATVAMAQTCTATASSFASWYTWDCGSGGSPAPQRGQSVKTCIFLAPTPAARINVIACEFEEQDDHCDSAENVVAIPLQIQNSELNYTPAPDAEHNGGCEHPERCWIYGVSGEDEWVIAIGIAQCYGQLLTCERRRPDDPPYGA